MTERVHIRYTKWDEALHWHFDATVAGRDHHGTWVTVPPGGTYRRGDDPPLVDEHGFVVLLPEHEWWTAYFNAVPRGSKTHRIYVDVNTPVRWEGDVAHLVDLDLDVTRSADGTVRLLDEDEFDEHRVRWSYPDRIVDATRTAAAALVAAIEAGREPFATAGFRRVAAELGWVSGTADGPDRVTLEFPISAHTVSPTVEGSVVHAGTRHQATLRLPGATGTPIDSLALATAAPMAPGDHLSVWLGPSTTLTA